MSIRLRFTLALTAVGVVLFGTYAFWSYHEERQDLEKSTTKEIRLVGQSLESSFGNALRDRRHADIEGTLRAIETVSHHMEIHIHDPAGHPIIHSQGASIDPTIEELASRAALTKKELVTFDPPDDPQRIIFTGPLTADDGEVLGSLAISRSASDLIADLDRTRDRLLIALTGLLVATVIAGLLLGTVQVTRPIARLLEGVRHVREGDYAARVTPGTQDEIGKLVDEFNAMIAALADSRAAFEEEAEVRARLEVGLQRVDKLVTIGQLSAGLAHEIGSPLQVLSGRASALLDHPDPEVQRQANQLVKQCERITKVVEQLLSFGRRKPAMIGPCELTTPVTAVIDLLGSELRKRGITLQLQAANGPYEIVGDVDQLQQVTLNLVRNALAATPRGGKITVKIERIDRKVQLVVRDTGPGIDPEVQAHLFEPFFTTRAQEGGTGLGLAVVRSIVEEHGGKIDVHSEPGAGAEFVVSFPHRKETDHA